MKPEFGRTESKAKSLPAAKAALELLSGFEHVGKSSMYLGGYTFGFFAY
jgi:hypothetical protein